MDSKDSPSSSTARKQLTWRDVNINLENPELCPRCDRFKLKIDEEKQSWYCEGCDWAGSLKRGRSGAGYLKVSEAATALKRWHRVGPPKGEKTGWPDLDELYTVRRGEWTLVTGIPGHGKSEFMDALTMNLARRGWKFGFFSPENMPYELHVAKLMEKFVGKPFSGESKMGSNELALAGEFLESRFFYLEPAEINLEAILAQARKLIEEKGVNGIVIDPWNEIEHAIPQGMGETQYTSRALAKLRRFARFFHVHIWLVAHPTKLKKESNGKYPVPTPYDVSGSAHFRNKADNAISIYRNVGDNDEETTEIHIQKIRFKVVGRVGARKLSYHYLTGEYTDSTMANIRVIPPIEDFKKRFNLEGDEWTFKGVGRVEDDPEENRPVNWTRTPGKLEWSWTEGLTNARVRMLRSPSSPSEVFASVWQDGIDAWEEEFLWSELDKKTFKGSGREIIEAMLKGRAFAWCEQRVMSAQVAQEAAQTSKEGEDGPK